MRATEPQRNATPDTEGEGFASISRKLFTHTLHIAPIRHHSPACAWAVRAMLREVRPDHVLIEAPSDFAQHIDLILDVESRPPIAIAALIPRDDAPRIGGYFPFCRHSPEYVALQTAREIEAEIGFIDRPSTDKAMTPEAADHPVPLQSDRHFDSGDFVAALARQTGCRDGFELWDHLFETSLGSPDWRTLFMNIGAYCAAMRAATDEATIVNTGDAAREDTMRAHIETALSKGTVAAIVGGFHAPALIGAAAKDHKISAPKPADSYLIRYSFPALDALNGYGAGLRNPGYYEALWQAAENAEETPDWREIALDLVTGFCRAQRDGDNDISVPLQVEALRAAESLAAMRGRPGPLQHDLIDALRTSLVKGEAAIDDIWTQRFELFLRGTKIGDIPLSAGSPPLVEDARARARSHRLDISDSARRRRKLDYRRKPAHLEASQFFHAIGLLAPSFAAREIGPDYIGGTRIELLFEEWSFSWSPQVEGELVENAVLGDRIATACLALLHRRRAKMEEQGEARDLSAMLDLFCRGLLAGLGAHLHGFLYLLASDIQNHGEFAEVAQALRRLEGIARSAGPIGAPDNLDLASVRDACYARLVYLCDTLPTTPAENVPATLDALKLVATLLAQAPDLFDHSLFDAAIDRIADADAPPEILGAVLAICMQSGRRNEADMLGALAGRFNGSSLHSEERIGVLRGLLATAPSLLWQYEALISAVDLFLTELSEEDFLELLPHLRLAFTALNPRETDRLAELLAKHHGVEVHTFAARQTQDGAVMQAALSLEKSLRETVRADGLEDWLLS